jgi:hypothetical protein
VLVTIEDGSVQDTITVNDSDLEVVVIDWDELEIDTDAGGFPKRLTQQTPQRLVPVRVVAAVA